MDGYRILVLNGPNMNLLGTREPEKYGAQTLLDIQCELDGVAEGLNVTLRHAQHNGEGELVDEIHRAYLDGFDGVILNAASYTHTSIALRDAISATRLPTVEVHMTNTQAREAFRHASMIAPVCAGLISGFGPDSYLLALSGLYNLLKRRDEDE